MVNVIFNDLNYEILPKKLETFEKYCKILQWGRQHPTRFAEQFMNLQFTDMQKWIILSSWVPSTCVWLLSRGSGKALDLHTKVCPVVHDRKSRNGVEKREPKTIGELQVGDLIYDETGNPTTVLHLNPIILEDEYKVYFEDGEVINCNGEHLWKVWDTNFDRGGNYDDKWVLRSTDFIYHTFYRGENSKKGWRDSRYKVPINGPINYPQRTYFGERTVDPYLLGVWLGDGSKNAPNIASSGRDVDEMMSLLSPYCTYIEKEKVDNYKDSYIIKMDMLKQYKEDCPNDSVDDLRKNTLVFKLKNLGVFNNKHIPDQYMYAPIEDRMALLQGLMDTDGTIDKGGGCEFTQTNKVLFDQVCQLVASLGIMATPTHKEHTGYIKKDGTEADTWRLFFMPSKNIPVFRLKRKLARQREDVPIGTTRKSIVKVEKTGKKIPMRCITVSNQSGLFLCGEHYTVTHNSYMGAIFLMLKAMLFPHTNSYILAPTGNQAQETFTKMENIAKNNIASAIGVTRVFLDETVKYNSKADPFTHDSASYTVSLYNGSTINTLNSVAKSIVGIRSKGRFEICRPC